MVTEQDVLNAAKAIRQGDLVAFPTETVYGLGANALDAQAVVKIFELKGRPRFDPLIVHVASRDELLPLVEHIPDAARTLIERFWPGPLSVVLPKKPRVPDIVTSGLASVAVRCPAHPIAKKLIETSGTPIAAPSANVFCSVSPTTAQHVAEQFGDRLPNILDGGSCDVGVESTVVSFLDARPVLLRPGGVTAEQIEELVGPLRAEPNEAKRPVAPGRLPRHYAPSTPLVLATDPHPQQPAGRAGLLSFGKPANENGFVAVEILSERECLREAAANLFAAVRRLDARQLDLIIARPVPETGLGRAIMDRLRRAAAK